MGLLRGTAATGRRSNATGGARFVAVSMIGGLRTGFFVVQYSTNRREAKVFRAHAAPQGMCDNLTNSVKVLTNQQKDGDSPVENYCYRCKGKESQRYYGSAQEVHRSEQSQGSEGGWLAPRHKILQGGEAKVYSIFSRSGHPRRSG